MFNKLRWWLLRWVMGRKLRRLGMNAKDVEGLMNILPTLPVETRNGLNRRTMARLEELEAEAEEHKDTMP